MNKQELIDKIDRLGEEWYEASQNGNSAVVLKLQAEIFQNLESWIECSFSKNNQKIMQEAMCSFFLNGMKKFDLNCGGEKRRFFIYAKNIMNLRKKDVIRNLLGGEEKQSVLDEEIEQVQDNTNILNDVVGDESLITLLTLIMKMPQSLSGRADNPARRNYFQLFTTDYITTAIKISYSPSFLKHETDIMEAMKLSFLDFYMSGECRKIEEIFEHCLKLYGEVVENQPMKELDLPLRNPVYVTYLNEKESYKASDSAVSNQRKAYQELLSNLRGEA